jgi:hypothetical protein
LCVQVSSLFCDVPLRRLGQVHVPPVLNYYLAKDRSTFFLNNIFVNMVVVYSGFPIQKSLLKVSKSKKPNVVVIASESREAKVDSWAVGS